MQFLIEQSAVEEMLSMSSLSPDCYADDSKRYPHHFYKDGEKMLVVRAVYSSLKQARVNNDHLAIAHLTLHAEKIKIWAEEMERQKGQLGDLNIGAATQRNIFGTPFAAKRGGTASLGQKAKKQAFFPLIPVETSDLQLAESFVGEMVLRTFYFKGVITGGEMAADLRVPYYGVISPILEGLRRQELLDISGQLGVGESGYQYMLTDKGVQRSKDILEKTAYSGPMPVPFSELVRSNNEQTIKNVVVTRENIRKAFADLIISEATFASIGPAVNSGSSIFLFGAPGNGKTSIAERITRLMGDEIFIPYAIEVDGQIIKVYDPINHTALDDGNVNEIEYDARWVKIKRPVVVVGGELTMPSLDLIYNREARVYEAPFQMKANGGIFLIDDFGRQMMRPQELLNRWIVPLEKRYDYLTLVTGKKLEVPFDQLICFSTNLQPEDVADEAFLRRIKYKINIPDPEEAHFRSIFKMVCKGRKVPYEEPCIDYLILKWYKPFNRPFRSCQPRDIVDQIISLAKYNMEDATLTPDLIDAACNTYFVGMKEKSGNADFVRPSFD